MKNLGELSEYKAHIKNIECFGINLGVTLWNYANYANYDNYIQVLFVEVVVDIVVVIVVIVNVVVVALLVVTDHIIFSCSQ